MPSAERPVVLFHAPSGWVNKRNDEALAAQRLARFLEHVKSAGWDPEPWHDREDAVDLASKLRARVLVVPSHAHADGVATRARKLEPPPTVLVAIEARRRRSRRPLTR